MLYTHIENCIRNLRALKLDTSGYGSLLIPILKDRLPDEINVIISRQFCGNIWQLDKVMEFFGNKLKAQENCNPLKVNPDSLKRKNPYTASGYLVIIKGSIVYIVMEIIFPLNLIKSLIVSPGRPFCAKVEDVSSV